MDPNALYSFFTPASLSLKCAASIRSPPDPKPGQTHPAIPHTPESFRRPLPTMLAGPLCRNEEKRRCRPENAAAPPAAGAENITTLQRITFRKAIPGRMESDCFLFVRRTTAVRFGGSPYPAEAAASGHGVTSRPLDEFCGGTESDGTATLGILESVSINRDTDVPSRPIRLKYSGRHASAQPFQRPAAESPSTRFVAENAPTVHERAIAQSNRRPFLRKRNSLLLFRNGIRIQLPSIELFSVQPGNRIYPIRSPARRTRRPPRQT